MSIQHSEKIELDDLRREIREKVIKDVIPDKYIDDQTVIHINPCGLFIMGGPQVSKWWHVTSKSHVFLNDVHEYLLSWGIMKHTYHSENNA